MVESSGTFVLFFAWYLAKALTMTAQDVTLVISDLSSLGRLNSGLDRGAIVNLLGDLSANQGLIRASEVELEFGFELKIKPEFRIGEAEGDVVEFGLQVDV